MNLSLGLMNSLTVKMYREMKVLLHAFSTLAVVGGEWLASCSGHFTPKEGPQYLFCRGLNGFQSWSGNRGEEKNLLIMPGMEV
jgi:hypothetical protein